MPLKVLEGYTQVAVEKDKTNEYKPSNRNLFGWISTQYFDNYVCTTFRTVGHFIEHIQQVRLYRSLFYRPQLHNLKAMRSPFFFKLLIFAGIAVATKYI